MSIVLLLGHASAWTPAVRLVRPVTSIVSPATSIVSPATSIASPATSIVSHTRRHAAPMLCDEAPSDTGDADMINEIFAAGVVAATAINTAAEAADAGAGPLKAALRLSAARAERGFRVGSAEALARLREQVAAVEALSPELAPVDSPLLPGEWDLDFTDAFDVLSLGLSPLEIGTISQNVRLSDEPGTLLAENVVEVLPPLSSLLANAGVPLPRAATEYCIGATCKRQTERRVGLVFDRVRVKPYLPFVPFGLPDGLKLEGGLPQPAVEALQRLTENNVYLETTYLDDDLRVARGPQGEIYVLSRRQAV